MANGGERLRDFMLDCGTRNMALGSHVSRLIANSTRRKHTKKTLHVNISSKQYTCNEYYIKKKHFFFAKDTKWPCQTKKWMYRVSIYLTVGFVCLFTLDSTAQSFERAGFFFRCITILKKFSIKSTPGKRKQNFRNFIFS